jgi:hypothetical protein
MRLWVMWAEGGREAHQSSRRAGESNCDRNTRRAIDVLAGTGSVRCSTEGAGRRAGNSEAVVPSE